MAMHDENACPACKADLQGAEIPVESRQHYNQGPNGEFLSTAEDYAAVADQLTNPTTHFSRVIGIEYSYDHPEHWDGVSEWMCPDCGYREGRFTGNALAEGDFEPRLGRRQ